MLKIGVRKSPTMENSDSGESQISDDPNMTSKYKQKNRIPVKFISS